MAYADYRAQLIHSFYRRQINAFVGTMDVGKPTIVLLPGGMGSELARSELPFPAQPNAITDTIWMDLGIIFAADALKLEIDSQSRDIGAYVTAATGPYRFLDSTPYDRFIAFASDRSWNLVVFGYDWRRPLAESADFLKFFISEIRRQALDVFHKDPIPNVSIVTHSMGGTVVTLALRDPAFRVLPFKSIVTVAAPFYGTSTHQHRYYVGQKPLNALYSVETVARIIATLPGPYSLMLLPKPIFDRDGAKLGLTKYPVRDFDTDTPTDPFDAHLRPRWPAFINLNYLAPNRAALDEIAQPVDAAILPKFFNVRSGVDKGTAVALRWRNIDGATFHPESGQSPLVPIAGPGDGTVPAWSAWHVSALATNRYELRRASDHGLLFEHPEVMGAIDSIVSKGKLPKPVKLIAFAKTMPKPKVASDTAVDKVMAQAAIQGPKGGSPPEELFNKDIQRAIISQLLSYRPDEQAVAAPDAELADPLATLSGKIGGKRKRRARAKKKSKRSKK